MDELAFVVVLSKLICIWKALRKEYDHNDHLLCVVTRAKLHTSSLKVALLCLNDEARQGELKYSTFLIPLKMVWENCILFFIISLVIHQRSQIEQTEVAGPSAVDSTTDGGRPPARWTIGH